MKSVNKNKNDELCYESRKVERLMERLAAVQAAGVYFIEDSDMRSPSVLLSPGGAGSGPALSGPYLANIICDW